MKIRDCPEGSAFHLLLSATLQKARGGGVSEPGVVQGTPSVGGGEVFDISAPLPDEEDGPPELSKTPPVATAAVIAEAGELGVFLQELGMTHHLPKFIDNAFDWDVLQDADEDDLQEIGVPAADATRILGIVVALRGGA